jgi:Tfp pilus assembly protein PilW
MLMIAIILLLLIIAVLINVVIENKRAIKENKNLLDNINRQKS